MVEFPTELSEIEKRIFSIDPIAYATTRNYADGAVSYLSPYISRGFISTRYIYEQIVSLELPWHKVEKFIQELAWRDYWQQVWVAKGADINTDLKNTQAPISNHQIPKAVIKACTGIDAVDSAIKQLYSTGYMHNHMRMYVASICCNMANSHWLVPSKWLYAHLLDGDLASNQLSWQWVAGAFSSKKYFMNQSNINRFFKSSQKDTFLDIDYDQFDGLQTPKELLETMPFDMQTPLPKTTNPHLSGDKATLVYNYYNIDPHWHKAEDMQRIFLLEPSVFAENPVSKKGIDFVLSLLENIHNIKVFVGEFSDLLKHLKTDQIIYREHPLNKNYQGREEPREWMSSIKGYFPSFFAFWKKCKKELMTS
jgi:deoxyribodipyrimidine photo-lyase